MSEIKCLWSLIVQVNELREKDIKIPRSECYKCKGIDWNCPNKLIDLSSQKDFEKIIKEAKIRRN